MRIEFRPLYCVITLAYMAGIYSLSSLPDLGVARAPSAVQLASNLFHIPLYGGLAFCFLQAVSGGRGGQGATGWAAGLAFIGTGTYAAFDEWHQLFVPGRYGSVGDFLLDLVGIGAMLLILRFAAMRGRPR